MTLEEARGLRAGDLVFWEDPDRGLSSRVYHVREIAVRDDGLVQLDAYDGSALECDVSELRDTLFEYSGKAYFRPVGRGICFEEPALWRGEWQNPRNFVQLEDLFEGQTVHMTVTIRRLRDDDGDGSHEG